VPAGGGVQFEVTFKAWETEMSSLGTSAEKERDSVKMLARKAAFREMVGRKEREKSKARFGFEEVKFVGVTVLFELGRDRLRLGDAWGC
jgi:hypothetical protein